MEYVKIKSGNKELCFTWFKKYLFGEEFKKDETNTKDEDVLWEILKEFKKGKWDGKKKPKNVVTALEKLKTCQPYYKDLLTPKNKYLYRAIVIKPTNLKKFYNKIKDQKPKINKHKSAQREGLAAYDYEYVPRSYVQSWTTTLDKAYDFISKYIETTDFEMSDTIIVIIKVKTDSSFFANTKLTEKIGKEVNIPREEEVLRLGSGIKSKIYVSKMRTDDLIKNKGKLPPSKIEKVKKKKPSVADHDSAIEFYTNQLQNSIKRLKETLDSGNYTKLEIYDRKERIQNHKDQIKKHEDAKNLILNK